MSNHIPTTGSGKGSAPRKGDNKKAYEDGWDAIFGKKKEQEPEIDPAELTWDDLADD
tara:strand:+ start:377 stop:547 length:171 start_codon:yes stop_codon:yes gene_type:complete